MASRATVSARTHQDRRSMSDAQIPEPIHYHVVVADFVSAVLAGRQSRM
jgi:hypothetical protein